MSMSTNDESASNVNNLSDVNADEISREMDVSQKLLSYASDKWRLIQKSKTREQFIRDYLLAARNILKVIKASPNNSLLQNNSRELMSYWTRILDTATAKKLGVRLSDFRSVAENCGFMHGSIGGRPEEDPRT